MSGNKTVGVIGAGSFGTVVANLLAPNNPVYLYVRKSDQAEEMRRTGISSGQTLHDNITPVDDIALVAEQCKLIFPVIPSQGFQEMIRSIAPYLKPDHIVIHGTKGLALSENGNRSLSEGGKIAKEDVLTMSQLIANESVVVRIGCLAGPNLSKEMAKGLPAATVLASRFEEVISIGQAALKSDRFQVYGSRDIFGVELAGVLKNILAIGSGVVSGLALGENARALLITKGLAEIINLAKAMGAELKSFLGLAGIGDIIATCISPTSRNYTVGYRLAQGERIEHIMESMEEIAEGVNTLKIANALANNYTINCPILTTLHKGVFESLSIEAGMAYLMKYNFSMDVEFI